ncbi:MAG: hypothetical protein WCJ70_02470 [bacterium]
MSTKKMHAYRWHVCSVLVSGLLLSSILLGLSYEHATRNQFAMLLDDAPRMMRYLLADGSYAQIEKLYPTTIAFHKSEFIDPVILRAQKRAKLEKLIQIHPQSRELIAQLYQLAREEKNTDEMSLRRAQLELIDPLFIVE